MHLAVRALDMHRLVVAVGPWLENLAETQE